MARPDYQKNGDTIRWTVHSDCISRLIDKEKGGLLISSEPFSKKLRRVVLIKLAMERLRLWLDQTIERTGKP